MLADRCVCGRLGVVVSGEWFGAFAFGFCGVVVVGGVAYASPLLPGVGLPLGAQNVGAPLSPRGQKKQLFPLLQKVFFWSIARSHT